MNVRVQLYRTFGRNRGRGSWATKNSIDSGLSWWHDRGFGLGSESESDINRRA